MLLGMVAYLMAFIEVTDPERYAEYMAHTPRIIDRFDGKFIARGGEITPLEGPPENRRIVMLEFPSAERAKEFYASDEYGLARAIRRDAAHFQAFLLEEMPSEAWLAAVEASQELSLP